MSESDIVEKDAFEQQETIVGRLKACIAKHPDWDDTQVLRSIRGSRKPMISALRAGQAPILSEPTPKMVLLSLAKVKFRYDVLAAIQREMLNIPRGKFILEDDLRQLAAGKDRNKFRKVVENNIDLFRPLRVKITMDDVERWYWGHRDDVAEVVSLKE